MQRICFLAPFFLTLFFLPAAGCGEDSEPLSSLSRLRVSLTDASALSLREFVLDIQHIEVNAIDTVTGNPGEWISLGYVPQNYNLLDYTNGKRERIVDQYFAPGKLLRARIVFGPGSYLKTSLKPSEKVTLIVPPQLQSEGLVIDLDTVATIFPHTICSVLLDINALLSIEESEGEFHFRPSIRAFPESYGGSLKGYVKPADANPYVMIRQGEQVFVTWPEIADGLFLFVGLKSGEWEVSIVPTDAGGIYEAIERTETIKSGEELNLNTITLTTKDNNDDDDGEDGG